MFLSGVVDVSKCRQKSEHGDVSTLTHRFLCFDTIAVKGRARDGAPDKFGVDISYSYFTPFGLNISLRAPLVLVG